MRENKKVSCRPKCFVDINDNIEHALFKLITESYLFVLDGKKLVGTLSKDDVHNAYDCGMHSFSIRDIYNENFQYTTLKTISNDLNNFAEHFLYTRTPVLNDDGSVTAILYKNSLANNIKWSNAQTFEVGWWEKIIKEMNGLSVVNDSRFYPRFESKNINPEIKSLIKNCWKNKVCLEIGAGPHYGLIVNLKQARARIVIEPLAEEYQSLREKLLIDIDTEGIELYSKPADFYITELSNYVDGLIICQNVLDHTPNWSFVLSNISHYAKSGACLYIWSDIQHTSAEPTGHFNITPDPYQVYRLLDALGFDLLHTEDNGTLVNSDKWRDNICISIFAKKR